jgi:uncharacterized protein (TIGR02246 family)
MCVSVNTAAEPGVALEDMAGRAATEREGRVPITSLQLEQIAAAYTAAWNSGSADAVAEFYEENGSIVINRGEPWEGRARVAQMAGGFFADVPDLRLVCDGTRCTGDHAVYLWTFTGTHAATGKPLRIAGWEEWDLDAQGRVTASRGWYDAADYARQSAAG